jgi:hypothetical protein
MYMFPLIPDEVVTVSVRLLVASNVSVPAILITPHVPFASSVTECPVRIATLSPAPGTPDGLHVLEVFQFVEPVLVFVAQGDFVDTRMESRVNKRNPK